MSATSTPLQETSAPISEELWEEVNGFQCLFSVDLPVHSFSVRELLRLEPGTILETSSSSSADVPVVVNSRRIGWAEFEVAGSRLGIRITELG
jgi:flagellar motor switch/type III secretory pathway protein FliN